MAPPIRANPASWALNGMRWYIRRSAAKKFHAWHLAGPGLAAVTADAGPLLLVPNHTSWWDGFFAMVLAEHLEHAYYVMMQADQLAAIPFLARCGAFSVDKTDATQAADDLAYAGGLLVRGNGVWVFPQGRRSPPTAPLTVASGAARLAHARPGLRVVPVAFRYNFVSEDSPEAFAWIGEPWSVPADETLGQVRRRMREEMERALADLDRALATSERAGFEEIVVGAPSANKRVPAFLARFGFADPAGLRNG
jgi:1-acyl-sn-glycerol-3-phosphate acyltransferase